MELNFLTLQMVLLLLAMGLMRLLLLPKTPLSCWRKTHGTGRLSHAQVRFKQDHEARDAIARMRIPRDTNVCADGSAIGRFDLSATFCRYPADHG